MIRVNVKNTFLEFEDEEEKPAAAWQQILLVKLFTLLAWKPEAGIPKSKSCPDLGSHRSFEVHPLDQGCEVASIMFCNALQLA